MRTRLRVIVLSFVALAGLDEARALAQRASADWNAEKEGERLVAAIDSQVEHSM